VADIFNGISKLGEDFCNAEGKDVTVFIGATRSGKSTTINLFLNNPILIKMDDDPNVKPIMRKLILVEK